MLKSAIWWTTMACNFKCKYCWEVQAQERGEFKPVPFRPAQDWLEAWNRLRPQLLDITGGEPFVMSDLIDVLIGLEPAIRVAITSNLSHPLLEFVKHVSPERVINVTASFHPMENGTRTHPMNPEIFVGRCLFPHNHCFIREYVHAQTCSQQQERQEPPGVWDPAARCVEVRVTTVRSGDYIPTSGRLNSSSGSDSHSANRSSTSVWCLSLDKRLSSARRFAEAPTV